MRQTIARGSFREFFQKRALKLAEEIEVVLADFSDNMVGDGLIVDMRSLVRTTMRKALKVKGGDENSDGRVTKEDFLFTHFLASS